MKVAALGNPLGFEGSITKGIVSGVNRSMSTANNFAIPDTVQTDAPISQGNSGGPLVTLDGVVVGVNRAKIGSNIGFAISPELVNKVIPKLIQDGEIKHPYMGVSTTIATPRISDAYNLDQVRGIEVVNVVSRGPSDGKLQGSDATEVVRGVRVPVGGDIILRVNDRKIDSIEEFSRYLMIETTPGETVTVTVLRNGQKVTEKITLGERPPIN